MPFTPQNFVNQQAPAVNANWLNGVDVTVNFVLGGAQTVAQAQAALGIPALSVPVTVGQGGTGATTAAAGLTALGGTTLAAVEAVFTQSYLGEILYNQTTAESGITIVNFAYPPGNILRYGTNTTPGTTDMTTAFQAAFNQHIQGGAAIYIPTGAYLVTNTVSVTSNVGLAMSGDGMGKTQITKQNDSDAFAITLGTSSNNQVTVTDLSLFSNATMTAGAGFRISGPTTGSGALPSITFRDVEIQAVGPNNFVSYIAVTDCAETHWDRVFLYGNSAANNRGFDIRSSGTSTNSTVHKFFGCEVYNIYFGAYFASTTDLGIEGVQFYGCDIVNSSYGVYYNNSFGTGYFPPQLTWIGGHINASVNNFDLTIMAQFTCIGADLYNSGTGPFMSLNTCSDFVIDSNTFVVTAGTPDGIDVSTTSNPTNCGRISNNRALMGASGNFVGLAATGLKNLTIERNQMTSGSAVVNLISGTLDNTILIRDNTPKDTIDIYDTTITPVAGANSLAGIRSDFCVLNAPGSAVTVTTLASRRAWDDVYLKCSSTNVTIQHNGTNPDGFILQGATNYTFPSTGGVLHLQKRNGGYWQEVGRD